MDFEMFDRETTDSILASWKERDRKMEEWVEANKEKVSVAVREYTARMREQHKTHHGVSMDEYIDCPRCGAYRSVWYEGGYWKPCSYGCGFFFPRHLEPLGRDELSELMDKERNAERMKLYE